MESPAPDWMLPKVWEWMGVFSEYMVDDECPKTETEMLIKRERDLHAKAFEFAFIGDETIPLGVVWAEKNADGIYFGHLVFDRGLLTPSQKFRYTQNAMRVMFDSGVKKLIWLSLASNRPFKLFLRKLRANRADIVANGASVNGLHVPVEIYISERVTQ